MSLYALSALEVSKKEQLLSSEFLCYETDSIKSPLRRTWLCVAGHLTESRHSMYLAGLSHGLRAKKTLEN